MYLVSSLTYEGETPTVTDLAVMVPIDAVCGSGYEVRATSSCNSGVGVSSGGTGGVVIGGSSSLGAGGSASGGPFSGDFTVVPPDEIPSATGTRYLVFQNGARVAFTLTGGALPTSSTPSVPCSVGAGYPLLITCNYDSSIDQCYYVVTFMDQTQWTLYPAVYTGAGQLLYCLTHLQDRVGNGLNFVYGPASVYLEMFMTGGIPLLSSINCASTGNVLLTFLRDAKGCIIELQDCYGRSVYYSNNLYYSYGSLGDYQHYLLTQVSQISATGTGSGSAAMRYESEGTVVYSTIGGFDGNMSDVSATDGAGSSITFDANNKAIAFGSAASAGYMA